MKLFVVMYQVDILKLATLTLDEQLDIVQSGFDKALVHFAEHKVHHPQARMLFLMPENTFTTQGALSYYGAKQAEYIFNYFLKLSQWHTDVIIMPGTIKRFKETSPENTKQAIKALSSTGQWFHHVLDIHDKSFTPSFEQRMDKMLTSNKNRLFMQNTAFIACNGKIIFIDKKVPYQELQTKREISDGVFQFGVTKNEVNVNGLNFGVEICCDNDFSLLASHASSPIDVHILLSATIPTLTDTIACHQDGVYIHCDASPAQNSIVIRFKNGQGTELKPDVKVQEQGIMAFGLDLTGLKNQENKSPLTDQDKGRVIMYKRKALK